MHDDGMARNHAEKSIGDSRETKKTINVPSRVLHSADIMPRVFNIRTI